MGERKRPLSPHSAPRAPSPLPTSQPAHPGLCLLSPSPSSPVTCLLSNTSQSVVRHNPSYLKVHNSWTKLLNVLRRAGALCQRGDFLEEESGSPLGRNVRRVPELEGQAANLIITTVILPSSDLDRL
jgi:hypothetical protein